MTNMRRVLLAPLVVAMLAGAVQTSKAQNVPDGFQNHAIVAVNGLEVLFSPTGTPPTGTSVLDPTLNGSSVLGGTYTLALADPGVGDNQAWFRFAGEASTVRHPIDEVHAFYEVFTDEPTNPAGSTNTGWPADTVKANQAFAGGWNVNPEYLNSGSLGLYGPSQTSLRNHGYMRDNSDTAQLGTFTFNTVTDSGPVYFGFGLATSDNGVFGPNGTNGVNTGFAYFFTRDHHFVPEPAFYQLGGLLFLGGLGGFRLRRKKS